MSTQGPPLKRIFFRLKVTDTSESDDVVDIVNSYLSQRGLALNKDHFTPHYIHIQPQEDRRYYHLVLDMNHAEASSEIKVQDVHHELYRVRLHGNDAP